MYQESENQQKILAIITIDLGNNQNDIINIRKGDDINTIAEDFCTKHNLDTECIQYIV